MTQKLCQMCEARPAVIRITATDADGIVLDSVHVCAQPDCRTAACDTLIIGSPSVPFTEHDGGTDPRD